MKTKNMRKVTLKSTSPRIQSFLTSLGSLNENERIVGIYRLLVDTPARLLVRVGVGPTILNFVGLASGLASAGFVVAGSFPVAFGLLLVAGLADAFDGAVARCMGVASDFGNFIDSVFDRYVDTAIALGVLLHFAFLEELLPALLAALAILGSVVTSYAKARGESLGIRGRYIGFMNRPERTMLYLIGFLFPVLLPILLWPLTILANLTAIHRIVFYLSRLRHHPRSADAKTQPTTNTEQEGINDDSR